jgi:anti-anti-sigma regulatory factor
VQRAITELDADGAIDEHTALCLRHAIEAADSGAIDMILVDLRDVTAISAADLALLTAHSTACDARGIGLGLLISLDERHDQIAEAFVLGGLGDQLHYTHQRRGPAASRAGSMLDPAPNVRRSRLARCARRFC